MLREAWKQRPTLLEVGGKREAHNALNGRLTRGMKGYQIPSGPVYKLSNTPAQRISLKSGGEVTHTAGLYEAANDRPPGAMSGAREGFFWYKRAGADLGLIRERVYVNAHPDHAASVLRHVVRDIVDKPQLFPGVEAAKSVFAGDLGRRTDAIVIYAQDDAAVKRIVLRLREYQADHPERFLPETPLMTEQVADGISVGSEPLGNAHGRSFGEWRAELISDELRRPEITSFEEFEAAVHDAFKRVGIDVDAPYRNKIYEAAPTPRVGRR